MNESEYCSRFWEALKKNNTHEAIRVLEDYIRKKKGLNKGRPLYGINTSLKVICKKMSSLKSSN